MLIKKKPAGEKEVLLQNNKKRAAKRATLEFRAIDTN